MKKEYDEKALLCAAKRGSQDAFAELVRQSERMVYNLALRMSGCEQDALDISQEAYLRAWKSLRSFEGACSFSSWMYTLTRNVCIDHAKREQKRRALSLTYEDCDGDEVSLDIADGEEKRPEQIYERAERGATVREAIMKLSEQQREVLVLYDIEGYSYADISRMLDIEEGTVKSRLWRARDNLRKQLKQTELF